MQKNNKIQIKKEGKKRKVYKSVCHFGTQEGVSCQIKMNQIHDQQAWIRKLLEMQYIAGKENKKNSTILFGIAMVLLFAICLGFFIRQIRKNRNKDLRGLNTWYVFFPEKATVPDLTRSAQMRKLGKWMKNGTQLYSVKSWPDLSKEKLEQAIKTEYPGIRFSISNTAETYIAS